MVCSQKPWTRLPAPRGLGLVPPLQRAAVGGGGRPAWRRVRGGRGGEASPSGRLGLAYSYPIASERPRTQAIVQILSGSVPPRRSRHSSLHSCGHRWAHWTTKETPPTHPRWVLSGSGSDWSRWTPRVSFAVRPKFGRLNYTPIGKWNSIFHFFFFFLPFS